MHWGFGRSTIMASMEDRHFLFLFLLLFLFLFGCDGFMGYDLGLNSLIYSLWATTWALSLLFIGHDNLNGANGMG